MRYALMVLAVVGAVAGCETGPPGAAYMNTEQQSRNNAAALMWGSQMLNNSVEPAPSTQRAPMYCRQSEYSTICW